MTHKIERPIPRIDTRPTMIKEQQSILVPQYNELYDNLRTTRAWRYLADNWANGTFTTIAGTLVSTNINLQEKTNYRTSQWPGAVQVYLVIRSFSFAAQSAIATVGSLDCYLIDKAGHTIPLGAYVSNVSGMQSIDTIIAVPITDPSEINVGTLAVTLAGTTPTVSVYNYQFAFSVAYLLPEINGYRVQKHQITPDGKDIK